MRSNTLLSLVLAAGSLTTGVYARTVPANLQAFYNQVKGGSCPVVFKGGLTKGSGTGKFAYCSTPARNVMWIGGPSSLADMDVDCDGNNRSGGKCANDPSGQSMTSFMDQLPQYGIPDLDANIHSFVVLGTSNFDPQSVGIKSLSVVAVVCGGKLFYGVWGDTNGATTVGESSLALANACFGSSMSGDSGHEETDVLYLAFTGDRAKIGSKANWKASNFSTFEASLAALGDSLVATVKTF